MNMVTKNAHSTAIDADSLAVNTPLRMPPRMMTMVIRPHIASTVIFRACFSGITSPFGKLCCFALTRHSTASVSPHSSPGSTPAMNSAAMETVPPAASEYSTALWLGGMRIACTEPLQVTAVANARG